VVCPRFSWRFCGYFSACQRVLSSARALIRHTNYGFVFEVSLALAAVVFFWIPEAKAQQSAAPLIRGVVVDGATGASLTRVLVEDEEAGTSTVTNEEGRFELTVSPGIHHLKISVVGYAIVRREVRVEVGQADVTIALAGGTGNNYTESVTVSGDHFRSADPGAPAQQMLGSADIQNLRGVLADDPLRAVQVLPGVASGDDLRSEFSVRGSNFAHMQQTVDGFMTPYLLHAVRAVEDETSSGSVAMINSDVLQDIALLNAGYVQRSGDRTGAAVQFNMRAGSRERPQVRAAVSGTGASIVVEGPLGRAHRGSWLASARQSYLDLVIERLVDEHVKFGFTDAQAKFVYDLSSSQRIEVTAIAGRSRLQEPENEVAATDLFKGLNASAVGIANWRLSKRRSVFSGGVMAGLNRFSNETLENVDLDTGHEHQLAARLDVSHHVADTVDVDAGATVDYFRQSRQRQRPVGTASFRPVNDYNGDATRAGAYGSARWRPLPSITLSPGIRVDHWSLTDQITASPWMQAEWRLSPGTTARAAGGLYQQFPDFEQVIGTWGSPNLDRERATHFDVGLERLIGSSARVQVTFYDREERGFLRRPGSETRLVSGRVVRGSTTARYQNRLDGLARGIEILVQRLESNGFSGWASYAYGRNRYADTVSGESFWGDLDQRHTMNLYGLYRLSPRTSFGAKLRMGSNFPAPGYYIESNGQYLLGTTRNDVRLPSYARLDLRANRAFTGTSRRLTLFVEVINVLNRENVRYHPPSVNGQTLEARRLFESLLPVVPSAGMLIEF
jgi:hypothetical protein